MAASPTVEPAASTSAASGAFGGPASAQARCAAPALAGTVVDVTVVGMGGPMMSGGRSGMGMARVFARPGVVAAGAVSLRVVNQRARTHELVVLPCRLARLLGRVRSAPTVESMRLAASARRHAAAARERGWHRCGRGGLGDADA